MTTTIVRWRDAVPLALWTGDRRRHGRIADFQMTELVS